MTSVADIFRSYKDAGYLRDSRYPVKRERSRARRRIISNAKILAEMAVIPPIPGDVSLTEITKWRKLTHKMGMRRAKATLAIIRDGAIIAKKLPKTLHYFTMLLAVVLLAGCTDHNADESLAPPARAGEALTVTRVPPHADPIVVTVPASFGRDTLVLADQYGEWEPVWTLGIGVADYGGTDYWRYLRPVPGHTDAATVTITYLLPPTVAQ